uniref:Uncharacterized protein n=1 Tax=Opuntia streptacantha TaxID=393608 RepID=A0A7C9E9Y4_OPUST
MLPSSPASLSNAKLKLLIAAVLSDKTLASKTVSTTRLLGTSTGISAPGAPIKSSMYSLPSSNLIKFTAPSSVPVYKLPFTNIHGRLTLSASTLNSRARCRESPISIQPRGSTMVLREPFS